MYKSVKIAFNKLGTFLYQNIAFIGSKNTQISTKIRIKIYFGTHQQAGDSFCVQFNCLQQYSPIILSNILLNLISHINNIYNQRVYFIPTNVASYEKWSKFFPFGLAPARIHFIHSLCFLRILVSEFRNRDTMRETWIFRYQWLVDSMDSWIQYTFFVL